MRIPAATALIAASLTLAGCAGASPAPLPTPSASPAPTTAAAAPSPTIPATRGDLAACRAFRRAVNLKISTSRLADITGNLNVAPALLEPVTQWISDPSAVNIPPVASLCSGIGVNVPTS